MVDVAGNYSFALESGPSTTNPDFGELVEPSYLDGWLYTHVYGFGAKANTQPIDELQQDRDGNYAPAFNFLDFYNRIHISTLVLNLGNVISLQEREISVFNAYFVPQELNDITALDDEGLTLTEPEATPFTFAPLQELIYVLSASTNGPPTIDATYTFDFDVRDFELHVVGVRIVAWYWEANWIAPVVTRLGWLTEILPSYDEHEQRIAKKAYPRMELEFTYDVSEASRRTYENTVYAWGARIWALPIWPDIHTTEAELLDGVDVIPVATNGRDFHVDGLAILIGANGAFESVEVESIAADSITIKRPLVSTWPVGTRLYPARTARMLDGRATGRFTRNYARGLARFKTVEEIPGEAMVETLYRDYPVMSIRPNWREAPEIDYLRKLTERSFGTGRDDVVDQAELALPQHSFRWTMLDRTACNTFIEWLYARQGRQKAIWLPTWSDDLLLAATVAPAATNIDFQAAGLVHFAAGDVHRRDVRIELVDGTVFYRRLTGFVAVDAATERVTMNAPFGQQVDPDEIESISWMHLVRLDQDVIEISWASAGVAEALIVMKGPRNDV